MYGERFLKKIERQMNKLLALEAKDYSYANISMVKAWEEKLESYFGQ